MQFKNFGSDNDCEVARGGENDSWYHLKCKITGEKEKLDKELKIVIREQSASSATIEVFYWLQSVFYMKLHISHYLLLNIILIL